MERAGSIVTFIDPKPEERNAIAFAFNILKAQKHAVVADETISHEEAPIVRIFHYKTCKACMKGAI